MLQQIAVSSETVGALTFEAPSACESAVAEDEVAANVVDAAMFEDAFVVQVAVEVVVAEAVAVEDAAYSCAGVVVAELVAASEAEEFVAVVNLGAFVVLAVPAADLIVDVVIVAVGDSSVADVAI